MNDTILKLTEQGKILKAKFEKGVGELSLKITRIVSATGSSPTPLELTGVIDPRLIFDITGRTVDGYSTIIGTTLTNVGDAERGIPPLTEGYRMSQIGVYAEYPDESEILYLITQFENPIYIPAVSERLWTYTPSFHITPSNTANVEVKIDPIAIVSYDVFTEEITNLKNELLNMEDDGIYVTMDKAYKIGFKVNSNNRLSILYKEAE